MAVEKMNMVQIVASLDQMDEILKKIFSSVSMELVDAKSQIDQYSFTIDSGKENLKRTLDMNHVTSFDKEDVWNDILEKWPRIIGKKPDISDFEGETISAEDAEKLFRTFEELSNREAKIKEKLENLENEKETLKLLCNKDIEMSDLSKLINFSYAYGTLTDAGRRNIRGNYENIPAAVLHLGREKGEEAYLMIYPQKLEEEIQRLKDSLNWKDLEMPKISKGSNANRAFQIDLEIRQLKSELYSLKSERIHKQEENEGRINLIYSGILDKMRIEKAKAYMAKGKSFFYLSAWVAHDEIDKLKAILSEFDDHLMKILSDSEIGLEPPTQLKNIKIFRPFESLVKMYGTPNYREIDPTAYFAITYMLLFGAMFGDLGQGAVFAIAGLFLKKNRRPNLGGVIASIGLSSMCFGLLYGSVFGNENLIPALLVKPFNNINEVLLASIGCGVILSSVSYILGIINRLKNGNIEEGIFGKEGLVGFGLYISLLGLILSLARLISIPTSPFFIPMVVCLALILFKQPIANAIKKKRRLYDQDKGSYYVESAFSLIEALISVFSGLVSFIRVGAFAINHVGLFMAFETMANMMGGSGGVAMLILGNIVIIGLEGLIVFIQSLRLEYYEMFSKYYSGDGHLFNKTNA